MTDTAAFAGLSRAVVALAAAAAPLVAGVDWGGRHHISGVLWRAGILVTSEQSLPDADAYSAVLPGGARVAASLAGRDASTNVAVLRLAATPPLRPAGEPAGVGALVLALGSAGRASAAGASTGWCASAWISARRRRAGRCWTPTARCWACRRSGRAAACW
jgi:S1-C subfamily serine protease